ncbi:ABC transporter permease [Nocardioides bigeumensis]|uniref:ABC transporter permease n=1 Tax=Nocardioides bigeumensis TaxID=433657 RepID=A0ABP5JZR0_9ACTN
MHFLLRRLSGFVLTVLAVSLLGFGLLHLAPGGPAELLLGVQEATPEAVAAINAQYGLDKPWPWQFVLWLRSLLSGDLGTSVTTGASVNDMIAGRIGVTVELVVASLVLSVVVGVTLGAASALRRATWLDSVIRNVTMVAVAVPGFAFGLGFVYLFGYVLEGVFPHRGWVPIEESVAGNFQHLLLPTLTLSLPAIAIVAKMTRSSMLETINADSVWYARSWGHSPWRVMSRFMLRRALTPVVPTIGLLAATSVGGTVVVEEIFGLPGLGSLLLLSLDNRDYPAVNAVMLIMAIIAVGSSVLADLVNVYIDPRQRRAATVRAKAVTA